MLDLPSVREQSGPFGHQNLVCGWVWRHVALTVCSCWREAERNRGGGTGLGLHYLEPPNPDAGKLGKAAMESLKFLCAFWNKGKEPALRRSLVLDWKACLSSCSAESFSQGFREPKTSEDPENHLGGVIQSSIWLKLPEHQLDHSDSENWGKQSK